MGPTQYCLSHSASPTWPSALRNALLAGWAQGVLFHGHLAWVGAVFVVVLFSLSGASGIFFLDYFGIFPALSLSESCDLALCEVTLGIPQHEVTSHSVLAPPPFFSSTSCSQTSGLMSR